MGTLSGAPGGQVKFHSEKCCGSPYNLTTLQASALTVSATETWLTVSLNQRHLLIIEILWCL